MRRILPILAALAFNVIFLAAVFVATQSLPIEAFRWVTDPVRLANHGNPERLLLSVQQSMQLIVSVGITVAALIALLWQVILARAKPRDPKEAMFHRTTWFILLLVAFVLSAVAAWFMIELRGHFINPKLEILVSAAIGVASTVVGYWLVGGLLATSRPFRHCVWLGGRLV